MSLGSFDFTPPLKDYELHPYNSPYGPHKVHLVFFLKKLLLRPSAIAARQRLLLSSIYVMMHCPNTTATDGGSADIAGANICLYILYISQ